VSRVRVAEEEGARLDAALDVLLAAEANLPYANFLPVARRPGAAIALHRGRWHAPGALGVLVARDSDDQPLAALRLDERPFESGHLGMRMAKSEPPVGVAEDEGREPGLAALYAAAVERLREGGWEHLAVRTSTRDRVAPWCVQRCGGMYVDTQVSWMAALTGQPADEPVAPPLRIEILEGEDLARLDAGAWKRLARWGGEAFDRGPLVFDLGLPRARTQAVYAVWTAQAMSGAWADAVLVAWDGAEIVAFISMLKMDDVSEAADALVCGRGLGATLPEYRGLFTAIQRAMVAARPLGAAFMENETQVATIGSINVYAKLGFRFLRSPSTFHLRPGNASPTCG
jgi:hypothetical protein